MSFLISIIESKPLKDDVHSYDDHVQGYDGVHAALPFNSRETDAAHNELLEYQKYEDRRHHDHEQDRKFYAAVQAPCVDDILVDGRGQRVLVLRLHDQRRPEPVIPCRGEDKIASVAKIGTDSGTAIRRKLLNSEAPSMRAASKISG